VVPIQRSEEFEFGHDCSRISEVSETSISTENSEDLISNKSHQTKGEKIPKVGSLQSFVKSEGPIENFSPSLFSEDEIHKIAVLDLRILNLDRNTENILV